MKTNNDDELRTVRERLVAREGELRERVARVHDDLRREMTPMPRDAPDAAIVVENDEILEAVEQTALAELRQIGRAVERLEAGTYGTCDKCGDDIDAERLRVVPYAVQCRSCAVEA